MKHYAFRGPKVTWPKSLHTKESPFSEFFVFKGVLTLVLPVYLQAALNFEGGEFLKNIVETAARFLTSVFRIRQKAQKTFASNDGIGCISHLLQNLHNDYITYELFQQILLIFSDSTPHVGQLILRDILLNLDIWGKNIEF
jgi:hypothetical protein